ALGCWAPATRAALQFDVFLGYDNLVREANWFPVACEIFNDGPTFTGVFELTSEAGGRGQARRYVLELPTNTRKRFVIPVFGSGGRYGVWSARLLDQHGRTRGEAPNLRPRREVSWETVVLGALPRTFGGLPAMPEVKTSRNDLQPAVARLQTDYFPDNPLALEGLDALYLNSEKALDLKVNQVNALLAWLNGGGHLIVGVEQPGDVNGTPWLRNLLPCQLTGVATIADQTAFHDWLTAFRSETRHSQPAPPSPPRAGGKQIAVSSANPYATLGTDLAFTRGALPVAECVVRGGTTVLSSSGRPVVIEAPRGRGKVTVLAFSPEREPFRSWKNRPWFWARLLAIPP
ncbi:MAG: hypothetical protein HYZ36_06910, partial [Pedosphaera parvula]|nr:hypothetical protein [Pedosphaera parvula]